MRWPALAKRRQVLLPTALGWLAIALLGCAALALARGPAYSFLAPSAPIPARILVVEGWIERAGLDQAISAARAGGYERVLTAGGPIASWPDRMGFASYAELAADYLIRGGIPASMVTAVPAPASAQERTFLSAVEIRDRLQSDRAQVEAIDVFSWGCHARRTRLLYRLAFGSSTRIGILAGTPSQFGPADWWRSSYGAKAVVGEYLGLLWTELFFWPPEPRSLEERWAVRTAAH